MLPTVIQALQSKNSFLKYMKDKSSSIHALSIKNVWIPIRDTPPGNPVLKLVCLSVTGGDRACCGKKGQGGAGTVRGERGSGGRVHREREACLGQEGRQGVHKLGGSQNALKDRTHMPPHTECRVHAV